MNPTAMRTLLGSKTFRVALAFALAMTWCLSLLTFRVVWTWNMDYAFLVWNLGLATIPLMFSFLFVHARNTPARLLAFFFWLLFLPNAPYIVTDFIHLRHVTSGPIWLDILLLFSCSITGMAIAFYSLAEIHQQFRERNPRLGWTAVISAAFLCGFAIYLGRFLRWRSIDIFQQPLSLARDIFRAFDPLHHPRAWGVTLAFGVLFTLAYILLHTCLMHRRAIDQSWQPR
jgi:uncharacterized membrane protein